jgi:hypothetical protein
MSVADQAPGIIRFGSFEVDLRSAELRKGGRHIRLPSQSFQVLQTLIKRPGELVTREELKQKLWPSDSFGDFEHGLNAAVNRVREALGGFGGESEVCGDTSAAWVSIHCGPRAANGNPARWVGGRRLKSRLSSRRILLPQMQAS